MAKTLEQRRTMYRFVGYTGLYGCGFVAAQVANAELGFFINFVTTLIIGALIRVLIEMASKSVTTVVYADPEPVDCAYIWEQGQRAGWYDNVAHTANPNAPLSKNPYTQEQ